MNDSTASGGAALPSLLAEVRRERGLSQPLMAARLGVSLRQYQRWEHGTSRPRSREWARIAAALEGAGAVEDEAVVALRRELDSLRSQVDGLRNELARLKAERYPVQHVA